MAKTTLTLDVTYDDQVTDPEALASAADRLMETVLSTPGIMEEYGDPRFGEFFVAPAADKPTPARPTVVVEVSGGVLQEAYANSAVQLVLVDWDSEGCKPAADNDIFEAGGKAVYVAEMPVAPIDEIVETEAETALEAAGIDALGERNDGLRELHRWVLYDVDGSSLLSTRVYADYAEAVEDAEQANDILVLPLAIRSNRAAVGPHMDKYILFLVYRDGADTPYLIKNPPENFRALLAEWNALDRAYCAGVPSEWQPVNHWLVTKGIEIVDTEKICLDECQP